MHYPQFRAGRANFRWFLIFSNRKRRTPTPSYQENSVSVKKKKRLIKDKSEFYFKDDITKDDFHFKFVSNSITLIYQAKDVTKSKDWLLRVGEETINNVDVTTNTDSFDSLKSLYESYTRDDF